MTVRVWGRLLLVFLGLAAGVGCLAALELALRIAGLGEGPPAYDPMAGFSAAVPLFERASGPDGRVVLRVSPARLLDEPDAPPAPEREFPLHKPANAFRVFVVGGSSAAGFPYPPAYAFGAWLEKRLEASLPELDVEVVNAAVAGYSSRRVLIAVREIAAYEPDLVVVYSGHNEWAERRYYSRLIDMNPWLFRLRERLVTTRLFTLASHWLRRQESPDEALDRFVEEQRDEFVEMFAVFSRRVEGHDYATPEQVAQRDALYRVNLEEITRTAQAAGARVALLTLSQNFADWPPGASTHRPGLEPAQEELWERDLSLGEAAAAAGDCPAALEAWEHARALDEEYALLHFRIADCERRLGRFERARAEYRRASDLDRVPHGAPTRFNDVIRDVARQRGAIFVDADAALVAASEHGLVGDDLFVEFAHPNLRAQQVIAAALVEALRDAGVPRPASQWRDAGTTAWTPTAPETLFAAEPSLRVREHEAIRFTCVIARRPDCVHEHEAALARLRAQLAP